MFSLNKSLAKLKSVIEDANLAKKVKSNDDLPKVEKDGENGSAKKEKAILKLVKGEDNNDVIVEAQTRKTKFYKNSQKKPIFTKNPTDWFYEKQMMGYFSQFGRVTRLKIARSAKTGNPKGYGFIEFEFEDVAKIAAETMNNYLMFDHIVKCNLLPKEKVPKNLFRNWNRPYHSTVVSHKTLHNSFKDDRKEYDLMCKRLKRIHSMEKALAEKGINFKCVVVNRPTGLKKPSKPQRKSTKSVSNKKVALKSRPMQVVQLKAPKIKFNTTRRRYIIPRLMTIQAGFNFRLV
ncbi:hypothetical protein RDWZM_003393 [Blomia tropicalis]|uniref:RRM domain-containing protein n=1 Tax=Blomia tropicalis TaxID=40697 RepID=A0A9Q0MGT9_BLOTA|nr:hypothetical protein RDWZM_003393 [Blomia tropicalis]